MRPVWLMVFAACILSSPGSPGVASELGPESVVVAEMDGRTITLDDFTRGFIIAKRIAPRLVPFTYRCEYLDQIVDRVVGFQEGREHGYTFQMDKDQLDRVRRKAIVMELFMTYGRGDTIEVDEDLVRRDYEMWQTNVQLRSIIVASRSEAEEIVTLLQQGEDFSELARTRSQYGGSFFGGNLGWKTWPELVQVPEVREAAFRIGVGEVSDVIETEFGYHVIRVEDKRPDPQPPYDEIWRELFWRRRKPIIQEAMVRFRQAIQDSLDVRINADAAALISEKLQAAEAVSSRRDYEQFLSEKDRNRILASYDGGRYTVGEIVDHMRFANRTFPKGDAADFVRYARKIVTDILLVKVAEDRRVEESPSFRQRMSVMEESDIRAQYMQDNVLGDVRVTPNMAEEYYNEHRDEYVTPDGVYLRRIVVETKAVADSVMNVLAAGADFAELARARSIVQYEAERGGEMGYMHRGRYGGYFDDVVLGLEPGEVGGPLVFTGDWVVVQCVEKVPAGMLTLEEATPAIVRALEPDVRAQVVNEWYESLKKKYNVVVYPERLKFDD